MSPDLPTDPDCIFCKIVAGDIPCHKVYEDDHVLAFLDINPLSEGHTVLIPRGHYPSLDALPEPVAAACGAALPKVGRAVAEAVPCDGWNVLQNNGKAAGQDVMHVHFHIIPRAAGDSLGFRWPAGKLDDAAAARLKQAITAGL